MEHDHKYSGTLPLLAYAPHDFGIHAQRSRAYRARAAMGRTGVQPLRSHAQASQLRSHGQAPQLTPKSNSVSAKPAAVSVPDKPLFIRLWVRISAVLWPAQVSEKPVQHNDTTAPQPAAETAKIIAEKRHDHLSGEYTNVHDLLKHHVGLSAETPQLESAEPAVVNMYPVSKTYAAMRMNTVTALADDQVIPEATDLSHALAEIRQALREHEKLAALKQNEHRLS